MEGCNFEPHKTYQNTQVYMVIVCLVPGLWRHGELQSCDCCFQVFNNSPTRHRVPRRLKRSGIHQNSLFQRAVAQAGIELLVLKTVARVFPRIDSRILKVIIGPASAASEKASQSITNYRILTKTKSFSRRSTTRLLASCWRRPRLLVAHS